MRQMRYVSTLAVVAVIGATASLHAQGQLELTGAFVASEKPGPLERQAKAEREANRGTRKTMKECIKPGNVIDEDVQECIMGMRERDW